MRTAQNDTHAVESVSEYLVVCELGAACCYLSLNCIFGDLERCMGLALQASADREMRQALVWRRRRKR